MPGRLCLVILRTRSNETRLNTTVPVGNSTGRVSKAPFRTICVHFIIEFVLRTETLLLFPKLLLISFRIILPVLFDISRHTKPLKRGLLILQF